MGKRFKDFDRRFTRQEIDRCRKEWLYDLVVDIAQINNLNKWVYPSVTSSQADVLYAVYVAPGFEEWQLFRVAMKGLSTREKLFMCGQKYVTSHMDKIRVDNYIGALRRGGFLNDQYEVVK